MKKPATANTSAVLWSKWTKYLLVIVVFFLYGQSSEFKFVLDDDLLIRNNPVVQSGIAGIPDAFSQESLLHFEGESKIYRPATISLFALEQSLFGFDPGKFHIVNLILYGLVCLALFQLLFVLFPKFDWRLLLFASFLFLVHPIHTEVVANVKSQDELLAALACLLSLRYSIRYLDSNSKKKRYLIGSLLFYLLAVFSKESSVFFIAIFPLTFLLVRQRTMADTIRKSLPYFIPIIIFMVSRHFVLHGTESFYERNVLDNVLFGANGIGERTATMASILLLFIAKLFFPVNLSWDYSYNQVPLTSWNSFLPWLSVALFALIIGSAIYYFRKQPSVSWGILFFLILILPTSNIFFINLTNFAERFLFLPSVGAVVAFLPLMNLVAFGRKNKFKRLQPAFYFPFIALLILCSVLTVNRANDWRDNYTLFESAASNTPNSSRVMTGLATEYTNKAQGSASLNERRDYLEMSKEAYHRALQIFPKNSEAAYKLGFIYAFTEDTTNAIFYYRQSIEHGYVQDYPFVNLAAIYVDRTQYDSALHFLEKAFAIDSLDKMTLTNLTVVHYLRNEDEDVLKYVEIAERNGYYSDKLTGMKALSRKRLAENELPVGRIK